MILNHCLHHHYPLASYGRAVIQGENKSSYDIHNAKSKMLVTVGSIIIHCMHILYALHACVARTYIAIATKHHYWPKLHTFYQQFSYNYVAILLSSAISIYTYRFNVIYMQCLGAPHSKCACGVGRDARGKSFNCLVVECTHEIKDFV